MIVCKEHGHSDFVCQGCFDAQAQKLETMTRAVQKDDELIADLKAEVERLIGVNRAQGERHAKRCEEWAKTADQEREAKESALLQVDAAKKLLYRAKDTIYDAYAEAVIEPGHGHDVLVRGKEAELLNEIRDFLQDTVNRDDAPERETWMVTRACQEHKRLGSDYEFRPFWGPPVTPCRDCKYEKVLEAHRFGGMEKRKHAPSCANGSSCYAPGGCAHDENCDTRDPFGRDKPCNCYGPGGIGTRGQ